MRRLALLLGAIGAVAGGYFSYLFLDDAFVTRAHYKAFERLATSDAVEQEQKYLSSLRLSVGTVPDSTSFELDMSTYQPATPADPYPGIGTPVPTGVVLGPPNPYAPYGGVVLVPGSIASAARKEGIKSVFWGKNLEVRSVEEEDGSIVVSAEQPHLWSYFLGIILPVLGFIVPWGAIRTLVWVGYGFTGGPRQVSGTSDKTKTG
jgi:hypothetical protein